MPHTYHLTSIADVLLVPAERLPAMLRELCTALDLLELALGDQARAAFRPPFRWTDDGNPGVSLDINGEELRLEVTRTAPSGATGEKP